MDNIDNNNQNNQQNGEPGKQGEKLFTQEDVNRIVGERLARAKSQNEPESKERELQQKENELFIKEIVLEKKLPQDIADTLKGLDKDRINIIITAISPYLTKLNEPILNPTGTTTGSQGKPDLIREAMGLKG